MDVLLNYLQEQGHIHDTLNRGRLMRAIDPIVTNGK